MMICKKCGKRYDNTWKQCLSCSEQLVEDVSAEGMTAPKTNKSTSDIANPEYYLKQFKKFDDNNGKFCFTWNWAAAIFYWIWQLCRNLWAKCAIYMIVYTTIGFLIPYFLAPYTGFKIFIISPIAIWVLGFIFYGCVSNYDYYLKKRHNENLWPTFPFARFKWVFWTIVALAVGGWAFYTAHNMNAMGKVVNSMANPIATTGEAYEVDGVKYTPPKGWQILGQLPQTMPGLRMKNEKLFLTRELNEKGEQKSNKFGQIALSIGWPKKGEKFESLDQNEVKKMIGLTSSAQKNPMFKIMPVESQTSEPESVEINGRKWLKTYNTLGFKGQPDGIISLTYYTVGANRLVMLSLNGTSTEKEWAAKQIENFAATFEFEEAQSPIQ